MFLVDQIRVHCFARPNVYIRNDQSSLVPKNVCSSPGEKLGDDDLNSSANEDMKRRTLK